ncbi:EAL domain, c-di-GMP-specific phosphodiesterase class I (or its enzymatically inactive variant) [Fontimonas thermophila]|uniref:EAL domain, c-di-GMP-specific phosphodiesterase class I (Or its enzymatically inactive variant) n=1 Tax=Fontimonas thermophila TaxID=1076937 RepID=A0A1I2J9S6_9GAMM|nr:EAL domain-containing protein [Fontimonas thermophila]SFF50750.1 EAL domain, c-di-GMP-specific phosphodiesterase class I (or its enzymatically inactive variant) [Fontimonas thermophila]
MDENGTQRRLASGEMLFHEGARGSEAYLVESGLIEIFVDRPDGRHVLARLGPDEIFGELALIGDQTRSASARALEPTVLTVITHETLTDQLARTSPVLRHLLRVALGRWRDTLRRVGTAGDGHQTLPITRPSAPTEAPADRDLAVKRLRLEQALTDALQRGELELFYQPIVDLAAGCTAGFEALVRWHRSGQPVSPAEFMWVIEDSNLILAFGRWTLRAAAEGLRTLQAVHRPTRCGEERLFCSVNLSARQFGDRSLFATIERALDDNGLAPEQLRLEITESAVLDDFETAVELLTRCRSLGCKLVVDDFGTGYSALSYLHRLPVHGLKLDRSFIKDLAMNERGLHIVRAIGRLAADLDMYAVAEGIETPEQAALCRNIGIGYGQGYFFGRPLALADAQAALAAGR